MSIFYGHKYGCPKANLESLTGTQPHSLNVNHCILHYLTPGIEGVLELKLNPEARYNLVTSTALLDFDDETQPFSS